AVCDHRRLIECLLVQLLVGRELERVRHQSVRRGDHPVLGRDRMAFDAKRAAHAPTSDSPMRSSKSRAPEGSRSWRREEAGTTPSTGATRAIAFQNCASSLERNAAFQPACLIFPRREPFDPSFCIAFSAMWRRIARFSG